MRPRRPATILVCIVGLVAASYSSTAMFRHENSDVVSSATHFEPKIDKTVLSRQLGSVIQENEFPKTFDLKVDGSVVKTQVQYALLPSAQDRMEDLMKRYRPDYGAFVAMDATTGKILSMVSYRRGEKEGENLTLRATFPAASVFKVVTASAAVDLDRANPETVVPFNGSTHTLYKRNVQSMKVNRWTRKMTLKRAFAVSANVFFGKLGLFYVGPSSLLQYAERFLFNQPIPADVPVQTGFAKFELEDPWSVVSAASGFTRDNTMSPLHGALIAAAIANDGVMMEPFIVEALVNDSGELVYQAQTREASVVVEPKAAQDLRELFHETIRSGTSRKAFRQTFRRRKLDDVEFGGKTGTLTGTDPAGKCDWFVGYARFQDQRVAVAALTVNEKKWRVKSATLASLFFDHYLKESRNSDRFAQARKRLGIQ